MARFFWGGDKFLIKLLSITWVSNNQFLVCAYVHMRTPLEKIYSKKFPECGNNLVAKRFRKQRARWMINFS